MSATSAYPQATETPADRVERSDRELKISGGWNKKALSFFRKDIQMIEMRPRWQRYSWERTEVEIKRNLAKWHELKTKKKKRRWGSRWDINLDQIDMNFSHKSPSKASFSFPLFFILFILFFLKRGQPRGADGKLRVKITS